MSSIIQASRISSLDQFRGYNVAGMFVVNFLGGLTITHQILKHNNTHFSLADSIMPGFILACGFSFRLSFLNRSNKVDARTVRVQFVVRSLGLMLLSVMLFGWSFSFASWDAISGSSLVNFLAVLFKANLWEVLAIIGASQIMLLPTIGSTFGMRVVWLFVLAVVHIFLSWSFNYDFVYGRPNWMDNYWGASGKRAWDGGFFGLLAWSEIMLIGTLAYDIVHRNSRGVAASKLVAIALILMIIGYGSSCLSTLYDITGDHEWDAANSQSLAASPVLPQFAQIGKRTWRSLLAEPPFIVPPSKEKRIPNYWMMDKRVVSQSFAFFASGFALATYAIFVVCCDILGRELRIFQMFGKNPLAAYIIHHMVDKTILTVVPTDSPMLWCLLGLGVSFGITYLFVLVLEQRQLYLRL